MLAGSDAAPAGRRRTLLLHSGGAGAPPGGTTTPREELADGGLLGLPEARRCGCPKGASVEGATRQAEAERRKRGPAPYGRRDGAPRGATHWKRCVLLPNEAPIGAPSPHFLRGREGKTAYPGPQRIRAAERWLNEILI